MWDFPLFPDQASSIAGGVDAVYFLLTGLSLFFALTVLFFILFFAIKYRRGSNADRSGIVLESRKLELFWSVVPLLLALGVFVIQAKAYFDLYRPPVNALEIYIVGRQWMWKAQHPEGQEEINQLHVPVNRPVRLIMTSQDVIHSFYIPAFRVKQDVLPGRYTSIWFEATQPGTYHLFCAEYCGTDHAQMGGSVVVMPEAEYQQWLSGGMGNVPLAQAGEALFQQLGCVTCHQADNEGRGPSLAGVFGQEVQLEGGQIVTADEEYLRESIINPRAKIVAGYPSIMPTYQGQISDEGLQQIVAYLKSLTANDDQQAGSEANGGAQ
ncbi:MAG: cytochrome c oxidase subunit 2 [Chloroflexota bacterium]|nr:MAG: cytochrome c oxidase subunit 2 [Chloroflexota bacterium]